MRRNSSTVKVAWIGFAGVIAAAIITAIITFITSGNSDKAEIKIQDMHGDIVQGNKIDNAIIYESPNLSDDSIQINDITERGGLNLEEYRVSQSLKLNSYSNGFNGALLILLDNKVKGIQGEFVYDGYDKTLTPSFVSDFELEDPEKEPQKFKQALLALVDEKLRIMYYERMGRESARIDRVFIYSDKTRPTYVLTQDYSIGMGSYAGPISYFLEVGRDGIHYIFNKEGFTIALKSGWLIKNVDQECEILRKSCRYEGEVTDSGSNHFWTFYEKYSYQNGIWRSSQRRENRFWEYENSSSFDIDEFYKIFNEKE